MISEKMKNKIAFGGWDGRKHLSFWERVWWFIKWDIRRNCLVWLLSPITFPIIKLIKWRLDMCYIWMCDQHPDLVGTFGNGTGAMGELYHFIINFANVLLFKGYKSGRTRKLHTGLFQAIYERLRGRKGARPS